jgi:signal transduction histidine kinase
MERMFKNSSKNFEPQDDSLIKEYKSERRLQFTLAAVSLMVFMYVCLMISSYWDESVFNSFWVLFGGTVGLIFWSILFIIFRRLKKVQNWMRLFIFLTFYGIQMYRILNAVLFTTEEYRLIRNLMVMIFTSFYLVIFLKFNYYFTGLISALNLALIIFIQIYILKYTNIGHYYVTEISYALIMPAACVFTRIQYEKMINTIHANLQLNRKIMTYIDSVLDALPCLYVTIFQGSVVYSNGTLQEFLKVNLHSVPQEAQCSSSENRMITNINENGNLIQNCVNDMNNNFVNLTILNKDEKVKGAPFENLSKEFLGQSKLNFVEPKILSILKLDNTGCSGHNHISNQSNEENLLKIITLIDSSPPGDDIYTLFLDGKFHFLGVTEFSNSKTGGKFYFQVSLRKVHLGKDSWVEIKMTDVTVSNKIKFVEERVKMKEEILAKIAHEFKTPLLCVASLTEEIQNCENNMRNVSKDLKEKLTHVNDLSNYTLFLTNDIMGFLKNFNLESQINLKLEYFKISEVLSFCHRILNTLLIYNKDKIKYIVPILDQTDPECELKSDRTRLKQILLNLISNAVKFTKNGYIKLKVEIDENFLVISVEDTGLGIREEDQKKIFKEEKMLSDHLEENFMGSGLGLSISHQMAMSIGGNLDFSSIFGKGTKFCLKFPKKLVKSSEKLLIQKSPVENKIKSILKSRQKIKSMTNFPSLFKISHSSEIFKINQSDINKGKIEEKQINKNFNIDMKFITNEELNLSTKNNLPKLTFKEKCSAQHPENFHNRNYSSNLKLKPKNTKFTHSEFNLSNSSFQELVNESNHDILIVEAEDTMSCNRTITTNTINDINMAISESKKMFICYPEEEECTLGVQNINSSQNNSNITGNFNILNWNPTIINTNKKAILIIDDTPLILSSTERMILSILTSLDLLCEFEILKGNDGLDLLNFLIKDQKNSNRIFITIVDEQMEFIDGSESVRLIRKLERENRVKKQIICRCSADSRKVGKANPGLMDDELYDFYFDKPITTTVFKDFFLDLCKIS